MPFFSIIIPTYNRTALLRDTLLSIKGQSFSDFEVLVINDGGSEEAAEVIKELKDERFHYFYKTNGERGAARNYGFEKSKGQYINFFDSDDLFLPDRLQQVYHFIQGKKSVAVVYSNLIYQDKKQMHAYSWSRLVHNNIFACGSVFLIREIASGYRFNEDRALTTVEDWELWLRVMSNHEAYFIKDAAYIQTEHEERSLNQINWNKIAIREQLFGEIVKEQHAAGIIKNNINLFLADRETFVGIAKCNSVPHTKSEISKHIQLALKYSLNVIFRKRFWALVIKFIFK